ncbi:hypothetical protein JCM11641_008094 [Rhodosporidiobolus odoratus]
MLRRSSLVEGRRLSNAPLLGIPATSLSRRPLTNAAILQSKVARAILAAALLLMGLRASGWFQASSREKANLAVRDEILNPDFQPSEIGQVERGRVITFRSYLKSKVVSSDSGEVPRLWLTVADRRTIRTAAPALEYRVRQLNVQRRNGGLGGRKTSLVVLCADKECLDQCQVRQAFSCYGGYANTKPLRMGIKPWMQMSGMIDALETGHDVLFIDSDAALIGDPFPVLEPAMDAVDLIAVENATNALTGHLSSNFIWSRNTPIVTDLWNAALDLATENEGKPVDDILNALLKTSEMRQAGNIASENRPNWVSETGMRIHTLSKESFGAYQPWDDMEEPEELPVLTQLTCGGNLLYKDYIAMSKGFYGNFDSYYSFPPKILQLPAMVGTRDELKQLLKVAIIAAKMSGRALQPPPTATFLDVLTPSTNDPVTHPIYAAFPLPYLAHALDFSLLEPAYTTRAISILTDPILIRSNSSTRHITSELKYPSELDLRTAETIFDLVRRLTLISYSSERVVRLSYLDSPRSNWREWGSLPKAAKIVQPCRKIEVGPKICGEVCRLPGSWKDGIMPQERQWEDEGVLLAKEMAKRIEEPFPTVVTEFLMEGGFSDARDY